MSRRVNMYFDKRSDKYLEEVKAFLHAENTSEAVRYSLALASRIAELKEQGYDFIIEDSKTRKQKILEFV